MHTYLKGDPGRLRQVLINLGGNAIKFTSHGEVAFEVRPAEEVDNGVKIYFEVRDTGIGIPKHKINLLFNAFQQVDASTTRRFGGTGLGLAISKRLVELMGGEIGVESVDGEGSTFWFTAVFAKRESDQIYEAPPLRADVRGVHILAVDDNATNRLILSEQLASWGTRHTEVSDAVEALDMLHAAHDAGDPFRIVVTDMQMPGLDGESLGKAIKSDPVLYDTILIMMTSRGKRGDAKRLHALGFSAYLTKPVKQSQLYDCLSTVLGRCAQPAKTPFTTLVTRHTLNEERRRKARILLVEDNFTNQQVTLRILEKLGFRADVANNGREALEALEKVRYDLTFMDVQMPVMDGFAATKAIRAGQARGMIPRMPIIAMTAHAMKGDRERCIEAGMDDYVAKPVLPKTLAEILDKWLSHTPDSTSAAPPSSVEQETSANPPVFDREALKDRLMGDVELVREICKGFLGDMPGQMQSLKEYVEQRDESSAGRQAHMIKGAAANVGAMALNAAALNMEKAAKAGRWDETAVILPEMERRFAVLKNFMEEELS